MAAHLVGFSNIFDYFQLVFITEAETGNVTAIDFNGWQPTDELPDEFKKYDIWYFMYNSDRDITKFLFRNGEFYDMPDMPLAGATWEGGGFRRISVSIKIAYRYG